MSRVLVITKKFEGTLRLSKEMETELNVFRFRRSSIRYHDLLRGIFSFFMKRFYQLMGKKSTSHTRLPNVVGKQTLRFRHAEMNQRNAQNFALWVNQMYCKITSLRTIVPIRFRPLIPHTLHSNIFYIIIWEHKKISLKELLEAHVKTCDGCQCYKRVPKYWMILQLRISPLFHVWDIDFAGPFPVLSQGKSIWWFDWCGAPFWRPIEVSTKHYLGRKFTEFVETEIIHAFNCQPLYYCAIQLGLTLPHTRDTMKQHWMSWGHS